MPVPAPADPRQHAQTLGAVEETFDLRVIERGHGAIGLRWREVRIQIADAVGAASARQSLDFQRVAKTRFFPVAFKPTVGA